MTGTEVIDAFVEELEEGRDGFRVQNKVVTNFCKIDAIYSSYCSYFCCYCYDYCCCFYH